jgi:hypothetical protein
MTPNDALEEARRAGFDLSLIDSNLALTPQERALRHESALELMLALREAGHLLAVKELRAIKAKRTSD